MSHSALFNALIGNQRGLARDLLRGGTPLSAGEYVLLTGEQRALLEAIKSEIASDDEDDEDDEPSAPRP